MKRWQDFLDSISTSGGNILVLFVISIALLFALLHVIHHDTTGQTVAVISTTFSGFVGALLQSLRGNASRQQMMDRTSGVAPNPAAVAKTAEAEAPKEPPALEVVKP
jgi:hypothetical protein